jgi:hypothetical protein
VSFALLDKPTDSELVQTFLVLNVIVRVHRSVHTVNENAKALVVATKEIGLEVNADKTKHMVMSWERNAGRDDSVKIDKIPLKGWKSSNIWERR